MYKNSATGAWEHDFRIDGIPRYHLSYGRVKKAEAERLHAVAVALFRAKDLPVIEALRAQRLSIEQLAQLRERGQPFMAAMESASEPWPTLEEAVKLYLAGVTNNTNRSLGTATVAGTQLRRALLHFGPDVRLDAITTAATSAYQDALLTSGAQPNTVTSYMARFGALFRWFMRREAIAARDSKRRPRPLYVPLDPETTSTQRTRRERYLSETEASALLKHTPPQLLFPIACGLFAGLRVQEMLHLRTGFDVDLKLGTLAIQRQPDWTPKTARSVRLVPIAKPLLPVLQHHLATYASPTWLVPSFHDGTRPLLHDTLDDHMARIVKAAGLVAGRKDPMGVTYHTLRHTFASWLLMRGVDLFTTAQLLGNTVKQVEMTYGHLSKDHRKAAVDRLSGAFRVPRVVP